MSLFELARTILRRDLLLAWRKRGEALTPLLFFLMVALVFPLSIDPEPALLQEIGPGILWVAALLASLISLSTLFSADYQDGSLEQMALSPAPLAWLALWRMIANWIVSGLPLLLISPLVCIALNFPLAALPGMFLLLAFGTFIFSMLGSIGAALTVSLRSSGMLLPILILPLAVPVLIFGSSGTIALLSGEWPSGAIYMLGFLLLAGLSLAPLAVAGALRVSLD